MNRSQAISDDNAFVREAIRRVLDGDVEAFAVIVQAYQKLIAADLTRRLPVQDVQEVAQEVFVKAFRSLPRFRGDAPFRIWLLRIARYTAMDFWRKHYRNRERVFTDLDEGGLRQMEAAHQESVSASMERQESEDAARELLETAFRELSPDDRAVLTLSELEGKSMAETAHELGCGISAVKVRAFRARHRLRSLVADIRKQKETTS